MNFQKVVIDWYSKHKRDLPWRHTKDPYRIWLSEIMLQQTQVKQGLPYYKKFVAAYPSVFDLANDDEDSVLKKWQGLGYYSRARNLHATAKHVALNLKGKFPTSYGELVKLKGVGDYTASAIASFSFNEPKAVLDGNVFRVLSRYYAISEPINSTNGIKLFKDLSQSLIYKDNPGEYNQAIMEFGARQCKPISPNCEVCPLSDSCASINEGLVDKLPVKLKKTKVKKMYFNYLVFLDPKGHTQISKRESKGIWQNLYQFPLIESSNSVDPELFGHLLQQSEFESYEVQEYYLFNQKDIVHRLTHRHLLTKFWIILLKNELDEGVSFEKVNEYAMPVLIANFLKDFNFKKV